MTNFSVGFTSDSRSDWFEVEKESVGDSCTGLSVFCAKETWDHVINIAKFIKIDRVRRFYHCVLTVLEMS